MFLSTTVTVTAFLKKPLDSVIISDSSANVLANLVALRANKANIASIRLTDAVLPTLILTAQQQIAYSCLLSKITSHYRLAGVVVSNVAMLLGNKYVVSVSITDTVENLFTDANLTILETNIVKVTSITLTDAGTPMQRILLSLAIAIQPYWRLYKIKRLCWLKYSV